ncbi:MAG: MBL fold metallo-hydrolase [Firmicutes bacterium]|nr:MBL fold metallo-hydrolase [Bacillota bacterium]
MAAKKRNTAKNSNTKKQQQNKQAWMFRIAAFVVISLILGLSLIWGRQIDSALGLYRLDRDDFGGTGAEVIRGDGGDLIVHFIDVGQGDATIAELPDGRFMIIDAGPARARGQLLAYIDEHLVQPADKDFNKFDFAVLTHADEDHCGGFPAVLALYPADVFYRPNEKATHSDFPDAGEHLLRAGHGSHNTRAYGDAMKSAHRAGATVIVTDGLSPADGSDKITPQGLSATDAGYYEIIFFGPTKNSYRHRNDYSPVIIIEYENRRIALSGDAEREAEEEFVANVANLAAPKFARFTSAFTVDVIKAGHHGSRSSSSREYLETLTNAASRKDVLIIISCGFSNSYGHPHADVLSRFNDMGFLEEHILRTDVNSDIVISIRFDADANDFLIFHGATAKITQRNVSLGFMDLRWWQIALLIWLLCLAVCIVAPYVSAKGKEAKKKGNSPQRRR